MENKTKAVDETLTFRIPKKLKRRLTTLAQAEQRSISSYVRLVLERELNKGQSDEQKAA